MFETRDLIIDKGKPSDWRDMYENVWSRPDCNRFTFWELTGSEEAAKERMLRTVDYQSKNESYTIYEKSSGRAIGFYGIEEREPGVWGGTGLCIGSAWFRRGYGTQALERMLAHCRDDLGTKRYIYTAKMENFPSIGLASKLGFGFLRSEEIRDWRNGEKCTLLLFSKELV